MPGCTNTEGSPGEYPFPVPEGSTGVGACRRSVHTHDSLGSVEVLEE